jgi:hypothetical protein
MHSPYGWTAKGARRRSQQPLAWDICRRPISVET